ncbi:alpha/beta fold hydrolase [Planomonospora sp. ID67723]|uniref:alpha/beta hydrolase family protein n=1 Tax=Planomonospora sp. ID67723 TaxID=2738134 RepID=UPI0018C3A084|nr:alpha/beta fold hydrolase [Planomonospora sp. ID67723]MBG0832456.1 alpha/beta fold hydrolase [Planomonospora sp. ID67723]
MATMTVTGGELVLTLGRGEKTAGLRGDIRVPLAAVRGVAVVEDALTGARGLRAPGLAVPGRVRIGTWRRPGSRAFVAVRRGVPAVRVALSGTRYDELLVGDEHAPELAGRIRASAGLPAPVAEERVTFRSGSLILGGTLALPARPGPHPVVLIMTGSGPLDRDADHRRMPLGVSRDLAHALARAGVASFRYDKRGVGESQGDFLTAGLTDNVDDARAALAWLRNRTEIDPAAVFLAGHSEGAVIATALGAGEQAGLAGIVLLAGIAKTGEETLRWQARQIAGDLPAPVRVILRVLRTDLFEKQDQAITRLKATTTDVARVQGRKTNARWHREFIAFDPGPLLRGLRVPVLAVTGSGDVQVDPADLDAIAALTEGDVTTVRVPELSHLLRRDPDAGGLRTYKQQIRRPTDPEVLALVTDWVTGRLPERPA